MTIHFDWNAAAQCAMRSWSPLLMVGGAFILGVLLIWTVRKMKKK